MIKKYEDACRQAGLSEEQIKKIRQVFDDEKKRLKRETIEKAKNHIWFIPISELQKHCVWMDQEWEIPDADTDVEETAMNNTLLEQLEYELSLLEVKDRELILMCFDPTVSLREYARRTDTPLTTLINRRDRILIKLKKKFQTY